MAIAREGGGSRRRWPVIAGLAVIVVLVVLIVFTIVRSSKTASPGSGTLVPPRGAEGGALVTGQAAAPVKLEVYVDYMCAYCGRFERTNGAEIVRMVGDGTTRLYLHPLAFLDQMSNGTRYSTRAANAVATVYDRAPDKLLAFNNVLFEHQPEEGSKGLSDDRIADLAREVGVPSPVADAFDDRIFEPWVTTSNDAAFDSGIEGTPTVKINGVVFEGDLYTVGPLTQAVTAAAK